MKTTRSWIFLLLLLCFSAVGCVKAGQVTEKSPVDAATYQHEAMIVRVDVADPSLEKYAEDLKVRTAQYLTHEGPFEGLVAGDGTVPDGLYLNLTIVKHVAGDKMKREMNLGGEAELYIEAMIVSEADQSELGAFSVKGSSLRESETRVNGFNVDGPSAFDELDQRAVNAAAKAIAEHLKAGPGGS